MAMLETCEIERAIYLITYYINALHIGTYLLTYLNSENNTNKDLRDRTAVLKLRFHHFPRKWYLEAKEASEGRMMPAKQSVIQNGVSPGNEIQAKAGNILERVATRARTLQYKISMLG